MAMMRPDGTKTCSCCRTVLPASSFWKNRSTADGLASECKTCKRAYIKAYRKINADQLRQYEDVYRELHPEMKRLSDRRYRQKNQAKISARQRRWEDENRDRIRMQKREYMRESRRKNPRLRIAQSTRARIRVAMFSNQERESTWELIGCRKEQFFAHLQSLFADGMTWDNYGRGGWVMDHIIPCDAFDLKDPTERKQCFHYSNIQPLWESENARKQNKVEGAS